MQNRGNLMISKEWLTESKTFLSSKNTDLGICMVN